METTLISEFDKLISILECMNLTFESFVVFIFKTKYVLARALITTLSIAPFDYTAPAAGAVAALRPGLKNTGIAGVGDFGAPVGLSSRLGPTLLGCSKPFPAPSVGSFAAGAETSNSNH